MRISFSNSLLLYSSFCLLTLTLTVCITVAASVTMTASVTISHNESVAVTISHNESIAVGATVPAAMSLSTSLTLTQPLNLTPFLTHRNVASDQNVSLLVSCGAVDLCPTLAHRSAHITQQVCVDHSDVCITQHISVAQHFSITQHVSTRSACKVYSAVIRWRGVPGDGPSDLPGGIDY